MAKVLTAEFERHTFSCTLTDDDWILLWLLCSKNSVKILLKIVLISSISSFITSLGLFFSRLWGIMKQGTLRSTRKYARGFQNVSLLSIRVTRVLGNESILFWKQSHCLHDTFDNARVYNMAIPMTRKTSYLRLTEIHGTLVKVFK